MRRLRLAGLVVAAALALVAAISFVARFRSDGDAVATSSTTSTTAPQPITFTVTNVDPNGTAAPSDDVVAAVKRTLDAYVALGVVAPLRTGEPAADLSTVLTTDALAQLDDPKARGALLDEGLPPATKAVTASAATAALSSVAGPDGAVAIVAARIDLRLRAQTGVAVVDIVRQGDLVLTPGPEPDGWRIDSFLLHAERNSA